MIIGHSVHWRWNLVGDLDELAILFQLDEALELREARLVEAVVHLDYLDLILNKIIVDLVDEPMVRPPRFKLPLALFVLLLMMRQSLCIFFNRTNFVRMHTVAVLKRDLLLRGAGPSLLLSNIWQLLFNNLLYLLNLIFVLGLRYDFVSQIHFVLLQTKKVVMNWKSYRANKTSMSYRIAPASRRRTVKESDLMQTKFRVI